MADTRIAHSSRLDKDFELRVTHVTDLVPGDVFAHRVNGARRLSWTDCKFIDSTEWVEFVSIVDAPYGHTLVARYTTSPEMDFTARFGPFETVVVLGDEIVDCVVSAAIGALKT